MIDHRSDLAREEHRSKDEEYLPLIPILILPDLKHGNKIQQKREKIQIRSN